MRLSQTVKFLKLSVTPTALSGVGEFDSTEHPHFFFPFFFFPPMWVASSALFQAIQLGLTAVSPESCTLAVDANLCRQTWTCL